MSLLSDKVLESLNESLNESVRKYMDSPFWEILKKYIDKPDLNEEEGI